MTDRADDRLSGGGHGQTPVHPDDLEGLRPRWITSQGQLDSVERANLLEGTQWAWSTARSVSQVLDQAFVRKLHERCFGNVWTWAGSYRRRATSVGIDWHDVERAVRDLCADAALWFDGLATHEDLARFHHRFVAIHPFANGNGRTSRLLTDLVARAVGFDAPTWGSPHATPREEYIAALHAADDGELDQLVAFMWT